MLFANPKQKATRYDENAEITQKHAQHNLDLAKTLIEYLEKELKKFSWSIAP